jgi:hypothetical protein
MPSDEDEPEYLRLMREDDSDDESSPPPLEDMPMDEFEAEGSHSEAEDSDTAERAEGLKKVRDIARTIIDSDHSLAPSG